MYQKIVPIVPEVRYFFLGGADYMPIQRERTKTGKRKISGNTLMKFGFSSIKCSLIYFAGKDKAFSTYIGARVTVKLFDES